MLSLNYIYIFNISHNPSPEFIILILLLQGTIVLLSWEDLNSKPEDRVYSFHSLFFDHLSISYLKARARYIFSYLNSVIVSTSCRRYFHLPTYIPRNSVRSETFLLLLTSRCTTHSLSVAAYNYLAMPTVMKEILFEFVYLE